MLGVDKLDQMGSYYSFLHKSIKWWRKVFFWILEMTVVNSYIIHQHTQREQLQKSITHLAFRRQLIEGLIEPHQLSRTRETIPMSLSFERLRRTPHYLDKRHKRRDCMVCSDRSENGTRHLTLFVCKTCPETPALCPDECFQIYHTKKHYKSIK